MTDEELKELLGDVPLMRPQPQEEEPPLPEPLPEEPEVSAEQPLPAPDAEAAAPERIPAEEPAEEPFSADIDGIFDDPPHRFPEMAAESPEAPVNDPFADGDPFAQTAAAQAAAAVRPKRHFGLAAMLIILCLLLLGFAGFCIVWDVMQGTASGGYRAGDVIEVQLTQHEKPQIDETLADAGGKYSAAGVAKAVMPSIAEIYTYKDGSVSGTGSGIVLTEDGLIATNAHVVKDATGYTVRLFDDANSETPYEAELVGHDTKTDLAVLKIKATGLTPAQLGDSDQVQLGETVCALGNPAGLSGSITTGIISGVNRKVRAKSTSFEMECFQTDAAISPGNSGGALVNLYGQVIGITSSKYGSSAMFGTTYEGLGFAITINEAIPIIQELMEQGYVSGRVRMGIQFLDNDNAHSSAAANNKKLPEALNGIGILIVSISDDSDLKNTELKSGDWILTVNGKEICNYDTVNRALEGVNAGDSVHCRCCRVQEDGTLKTFEIDFRLLEDTSGEF
ncbi:MAG: trypsin-like peptidase domain-containing protein [Oscillospiraceae bacterium]|nr:trypsin-like peptidase domain-containing protein [Oscillospiraceae bacterium]